MRPTARIYIGGAGGYALIAAACLIGFFASGCPHNPPPTPTPVTDADAAPYVAPIRIPSASTCQAAAQAAHAACLAADIDTLADICGREDVGYAVKLMAARSCDDVRNADPGANASSGPAPARGR